MASNPYWLRAQAAHTAGDRSWLPCTEEFYDDMLNVMPPLCFAYTAGYGTHFAVSEPWTHTPDDQGIYLCFRYHPAAACRMATLREFRSELNPVHYALKRLQNT